MRKKEYSFSGNRKLLTRLISFILVFAILFSSGGFAYASHIEKNITKKIEGNSKSLGIDDSTSNLIDVQLDDENEIEKALSKANSQPKDFSDHITKITVMKVENGRWVPATEFYDKDRIRVEIKYQFGPGEIDQDNPSIYYQLPNGIKVVKDDTGIVYSKGKAVGKYKITTNGRVEITFNEGFIESGAGIDGDVTFEGQISKDEAGGSGKIKFPGESNPITIVEPKIPEIDNSDISVDKNGKVNRNKTKISYEVVASSKNGTNKNKVYLSDNINQWNTKNIEYSYDKNSIRIVKVFSNGEEETVPSDKYKIEWSEKTESQNAGFNISDLDPLGPGEKYKLKYDVNIKAEDGAEIYQLNNYIEANTGTKYERDDNTVKWSKDIKKTGKYDPNTGLILWTIDINPDGKDLSGWTFIDDIPGNVIGNVTLRCNNPWSEKTIQLNGNQIHYTFPTNLSEQEKRAHYTIFYYTKPNEGETQVTNTGELWGDGNTSDTAIVDIISRAEDLTKSSRGHKLTDDGKLKNQWDIKLTLKDGILSSVKYEDIIHDAVNQKGESLGEDSHYAIASDLEESFKTWLGVKIDDNSNYRYLGNGLARRNDNLSKDEISIRVTYYDKDGREISADDSTSKVKRFRIDVTPINGFKFKAKELSIGQYSTYTDPSKLKEGDKSHSKNEGIFGNIKKEAEDTYEKVPRLSKGVKIGDLHGAEVYQSGKSEIKFDNLNGKIKYRLLLNTSSKDNGKDIVLKDTLPKGAKFLADSLKASFYQSDYYSTDDNYAGFKFSKDNTLFEINNVDGREKLTITIKNYKYSENYPRVIINYEIDIKNDEHWKDLSNEEKKYINKVEWGNDSDSTETIVKKDSKKIDKKGYQLDENDRPLLDSNGNPIQGRKPSNKIKYSIVINPRGEDLDKSSKTLTLKDKIIGGESINPTLGIDSLKLYRYDPTAEDNKGTLVSDNNYRFKYNNETKEIEMVIPDESGFVLEYVYTFDPTFAGSITINNNISLNGEWSSNTKSVLKEMTSSATASKKIIKIYKVDEDNYKKLLPGTKFKLEYFDKNSKQWAVKTEEIIVNESGYIHFNLAGSNKDLDSDTLYRLLETNPLEGYKKPEEPTYFVWLDTHDSVLAALSNAQINEAGVDKNKIKTFSNSGGIEYISNKYTRLTVHKIWENDSGETTAAPRGKEVNVNLYRHRSKSDGFEVKVISQTTASWVNEDKIEKIYVNKEADKGITIEFEGWLGNPTYEYDGTSGKLENNKLVIPSIKKDTTVYIRSNNNHPSSIKFSGYEKASMKMIDKTLIESVVLNETNAWSKSWDNLDYKDENNQMYYYTVEEVKVEGYETSYTNNEGVQTGDINIINKKDKTIDYTLPETGGYGTTLTYKVSTILLILSAAYIYIRRRELLNKKHI
ncbi:Cna B-type domain-containing protein [Peptoniphilus asaccharolyticus]